MKIGIQTWGHQGDIQPFLALADGLSRAGHAVRLDYSAADGRDYAPLLTEVSYEHTRLASPQSPGELHRVGEEVFSARPARQGRRIVRELLVPVIDELAQSASKLAQWADVLVLNPVAHPLSAAAEAARKPFICVYTGPVVATRAFPPLALPNLGPLNLLAWRLSLELLSLRSLGSINRIRRRWALAPIKRAHHQIHRSVIDIVAMSPTLLPRPDDWPSKVHLPGFFNLPARKERLEPEVREFLAAGPAPVYVTFDGMSGLERNPRALLELTEEALIGAGCRAIVQGDVPTDRPAGVTSQILRMTTPPPTRLLSRCSAIIHHGGAVMSQAALLAGRPSVVIAHLPDHFAWGRRLHKLGVAPPHLSRAGLEPEQLLRAIDRATRYTAMRARAECLGEQLHQEDGVQRAVELIGLHAPC